MKTSEMIAMLEENRKLRFINDSGSIIIRDGVFLKWDSGTGAYAIFGGDDWQLVRTPVTWVEAIQAWLDGKDVEVCECAGGCGLGACALKGIFTVKSNPNKSNDAFAICRQQLKTAKFYIND